ncbi:MAG: peptide-methionine (S)-S-oxide reductase MsrA [Lysobacteraceae bacterium]
MTGIGAFKQRLPSPEQALPGREEPMPVAPVHAVLGTPMQGGFPGCEQVHFAMGCFWGAERLFWGLPGVVATAVGYAGGYTPNPNYREVCSGQTGHTEAVRVVYDPARIGFDRLLKVFWEGHDPTQGMRQGNDQGTQYRSAIHCYTAGQYARAEASARAFQQALQQRGLGALTTELRHPAPVFYFAEDEHQQYLHKNPGGYCGLGGTGVACPVGLSGD